MALIRSIGISKPSEAIGIATVNGLGMLISIINKNTSKGMTYYGVGQNNPSPAFLNDSEFLTCTGITTSNTFAFTVKKACTVNAVIGKAPVQGSDVAATTSSTSYDVNDTFTVACPDNSGILLSII